MSHHDSDLQITAPLEIRSILRLLNERSPLIHLQVPNQQAGILTTVLRVDEQTHTLIIDRASEEDLNQRLLRADTLSLDAQLDGVRVFFSVQKAQACLFEDKPALEIPFPQSITRVQRREHFRIDIPLSDVAICTLQMPTAPYKLKLNIRDISSGGLSLLDHAHVLTDSLGCVFEHCLLELQDLPPMRISIKVVRAVPEQLANEKQALRVGCEFTHISNQDRIVLQRYIGQLERKAIARQRGLD